MKVTETIVPSAHSPSDERVERGKGYIPTLDGWRAVAIAGVIFSHAQVWRYHGASTEAFRDFGARGVQLFFALSGYLICRRLLLEERTTGSISLRSFYIRRVFRIQPAALAYLLVLAILSACGVIVLYWPGLAGALLMVRNLWPASTPSGYWYTLHFWSLSVEEQFYLLLPGFLVLCRHRRLLTLSVVAVSFEAWRLAFLPSLQSGAMPTFSNFRTDLVLGGILLGSVLALALEKDRWRSLAQRFLTPWVVWIYLALVFRGPILRFHPVLQDAPLNAVFPLLIVATVLHPASLTGQLLELAPIRFIGRISYSLYLWQQLFFNRHETAAPGSFRSHPLLCLIATFACATISYSLVERPLVRLGHRLARRSSDLALAGQASQSPT